MWLACTVQHPPLVPKPWFACISELPTCVRVPHRKPPIPPVAPPPPLPADAYPDSVYLADIARVLRETGFDA